MITISDFEKQSLTKKGFRIDNKGELRYYGFLFWALDKEIIKKHLRDYKGKNIKFRCEESYKFNVRT